MTSNVEFLKLTQKAQGAQQVGGQANPLAQAQKTTLAKTAGLPDALATGKVSDEPKIGDVQQDAISGAAANEAIYNPHDYLSVMDADFSSSSSLGAGEDSGIDYDAIAAGLGEGITGSDIAANVINAENISAGSGAFSTAEMNAKISEAGANAAANYTPKSDNSSSGGASGGAKTEKQGFLAKVGDSLVNKTVDAGTSAVVNTGMSMIGLGGNSGRAVSSSPVSTGSIGSTGSTAGSVNSSSSLSVPTKVKSGLLSKKTVEGDALIDAKNKYENAQTALQKAQDELSPLNEKVKAAESKLTKIENDENNTKVTEEVKNLNNTIKTKEAEQSKKQQEQSQHINAQKQFKDEAAEKNKVAESQEKQAKDCRGEAQKFDTQIGTLKNTLVSKRTELSSTTDDNEQQKINAEIQKIESQIRELETKKEAKIKEAENFEQQAQDNREQAVIAEEHAREEGEKADALNTELNTLAQKITDAKNELSQKEASLDQQQSATQAKIKEAQTELSDAQNARDAKQAECDKLRSDVSTYEQMYNTVMAKAEARANEESRKAEKEGEDEE